MSAGLLNTGAPQGGRYVHYKGFTGLNTLDDAYTLDRSELAVSINLWSSGARSLTKRPGSVPLVTATGVVTPFNGGQSVIDMISCQFSGVTYLVALGSAGGLAFAPANGTAWTALSSSPVRPNVPLQIFGAEMFDPDTGKDTLFITDGVNVPYMWTGPSSSVVYAVSQGIVGGTSAITLNPGLIGGGNLITSVAAANASLTTTLTVTVISTTQATITDANTNTITVAAGGTGTIDFTNVTLGNPFAAGDVGKVGSITITAATSRLPRNATNTGYITPLYCATLGNNSHMFYSGEPTSKTAVYISDPTFPQRFDNVAMQVNPYQGSYLPALIGFNDGVEGGDITGLKAAQGTMVVIKQNAIYAMALTTLLGEVPVWQVSQVSSVGFLANKSIVRFEISGNTFIAGLGVDGVYVTTGQPGSGCQKISGSIPTFFDSSFNGQPATITYRTSPPGSYHATPIAVRHGNRYLIFFNTTNNSPNPNTPFNNGIWFDFDQQDRYGNPRAGQIQGMNPSALVALRGPQDDGNVAWSLWSGGAYPYVSKFGVASTDFNIGNLTYSSPITVTTLGKADLMDEEFGDEAPTKRKVVANSWLYVAIPQSATGTLQFSPSIITDPAATRAPSSAPPAIVNGLGYYALKTPTQANTRGRMIQYGISESSTIPWILLGYSLQLNPQLVDV